MMVSRYQAAGVNEVESVLNEFLALADDYERRGWGKLGAPGWINDLRGLCEARLAVYFEATGKRDLFQVHMGRALEHFKKVNPGVNPTEAGTREGIERLDAANIQPRWRTELSAGSAATSSIQSVSPITPAPPYWPVGPATKHAYLEVELANQTGTQLEQTAVDFGQRSCNSGILGADASKTFLGWQHPVTTNAVVRWLDSQKAKREAAVSLVGVYDPQATGMLTFTIGTTNVVVAFKRIERR